MTDEFLLAFATFVPLERFNPDELAIITAHRAAAAIKEAISSTTTDPITSTQELREAATQVVTTAVEPMVPASESIPSTAESSMLGVAMA